MVISRKKAAEVYASSSRGHSAGLGQIRTMPLTSVRPVRCKLISLVAAACLLGTLWFASAAFGQDESDASAKFITFSMAGSSDTEAYAINSSGVITGFWLDTYGSRHGFVRDTQGNLNSFDPPGSYYTFSASINTSGTITGYFQASQYSPRHGFVRDPAGNITAFDPPGGYTTPESINDSGAITGFYSDSNGEHGFLRDPQGNITSVDAPGSTGTVSVSINSGGAITGGYYNSGSNLPHGFVRDPAGTFTLFDPSGGIETAPSVINRAGVIAGTYEDNAYRFHGFVGTPGVAITSFDLPGISFVNSVTGLNAAGTVIGSSYNYTYHGFLRHSLGRITEFDPPNSNATYPTGINDRGAITGYYYDTQKLIKASFLRVP